jgi:hypothetical protein
LKKSRQERRPNCQFMNGRQPILTKDIGWDGVHISRPGFDPECARLTEMITQTGIDVLGVLFPG